VSRAWARGSTTAWRTLRAAVLARDHYRCRAHREGWCARSGAGPHTCQGSAPLSGGPGVAGHAHHTHGRDVTGDDMAYIVAACATCNLAIGDPQSAPDPPAVPITRW